nr:hypothetical protein [Tanacetum cinerariifolium]
MQCGHQSKKKQDAEAQVVTNRKRSKMLKHKWYGGNKRLPRRQKYLTMRYFVHSVDTEPSLQPISTNNVKRHSRSDSRQFGGGFRAVHSGAFPNQQSGSGIQQPVILASTRN